MPAILFGSISTLADTSELQRQAFNQAFATHGLDWSWDRDEYAELLEGSGGQDRIADYAAGRDETVDAAAVHRTKSELFQQSLADTPPSPRPGVADTISRAKAEGFKVALVTTTSPENVSSLLATLSPDVASADLDLIVDSSDVDSPKPDPAAYAYAVAQLDVPAEECVAIEDNLGGVASAAAAGVSCVAFPNQNTAGHGFDQSAAVSTVQAVDFAELRDLVGSES